MVGLTSSQVISARLLLQDLDLVFPAFAGRKKLVICDNLDNAKELEETIKSMRSEIQIRFINKETIEKVASNGKFGKYYEVSFSTKRNRLWQNSSTSLLVSGVTRPYTSGCVVL